MALDSVEKRASIASQGRPYMRTTYPNASGGALQRASVAHAYGGNAVAAQASATSVVVLPGTGRTVTPAGGRTITLRGWK